MDNQNNSSPRVADDKDNAPSEPISVRDSIYQALEEHGETKMVERVKEKSLPDDDDDPFSAASDGATEAKPRDIASVETIDIPDTLRDDQEFAAEWDNVPTSIKKRLLAREKEIQEGLSQYQEKARGYDEYEPFLAPRLGAMQRIGVSPAQVVGRAIEWHDRLSHPNPQVHLQAFLQLAQNYNVDLKSLGPIAPLDPNQVQQARQRGQLYHSTLAEAHQAKQQETTNGNKAALDHVNAWAKDKTHYGKVRPLMLTLLSTGAVPLKDNSLDLDAAYSLALKISNLEGKPTSKLTSKKTKAKLKDNSVRTAIKTAMKSLNT